MSSRNFKRRRKLIYRRYRTCPRAGKVLDAHDYGLKAWAMWVPF